MKPRLLVATSVHRPDDPRIRAKLIATLATEWDVAYAARVPGPSDRGGLEWLPLGGGRGRRAWRASRHILSGGWDLVAVHDPELLAAALIRSWLGRPTLFDLHENLPAQIRTRRKVPVLLRRLLASASALLIRLTERSMTVTLAEEGYQTLFARPHLVLANYLPDYVPAPVEAGDPPFLAYLGDVSELRGAVLAIEAAAGAGMPLTMVGRVVPPSLAGDLQGLADRLGVALDLVGELSHEKALRRIAPAAAGLSPLLDTGNYRHSLPTKVLEYMAMGLPVLVSDLPGTREPIGGLGQVTLVTPGDTEAWRAAGKSLAADPDRRTRAAAGAEAMLERFAWPVETVLTVYREAARG